MEDVQTVHRGDDHGAIHDVEVQFVLDDPTFPAVDELNGSVNRPGLENRNCRMGIRLSLLHAPDVYHERTERRSHQY